MEELVFSRRFAKRLGYLVIATVLFACMLGAILTHAAMNSAAPAWATPGAKAIRKISQVTSAQSEPAFLNNLDCVALTYRLAATSTMRTGCFTETAFGLLDSDNSTAIFNGTDEGLPILPHTPHQILAPWPKALDLIGLDPADNGGTLISLYKNPFVVLQDQRNVFGQVIAKQIDRAPDMTLEDPSGKPLVINPQTLAFSEGGAWLVAETLGGSFVRVNLATLSMTAFAPAYGSQGSPALLKSRVTITNNGRFVAIANDIAPAFKVYDLASCDGAINNLQPQNCRAYDYWLFAGQQIGGLQSVRHLRFVNEGLLGFDSITSDPLKSGSYELAPTANITSLTDYIGLGDSYSSGEGAFDYLNGTDTGDNTCHLARNSYPLLLAHDLFSAAGGHSVACSGAVIKDIGSTSDNYKGQVRDIGNLHQLQQSQPLLLESVETNFLPGYIAQQRFVKRWQPALITVGIGGNDIGFGDIVQNCVTPHVSQHSSGNTCYRTYEDRLEISHLIDRTIPRWTALYGQLRREAPGVRVYAVGYPQVAVANGNCAANVHLNQDELKLAVNITDYLNQAMQKAAAASGVTYVDISQALNGHRLCETASYNVAVNGLTAGTNAGIFGVKVLGKESYHPNALGHTLIEESILKQTHNLTGLTTNDTQVNAPTLLDAPVSGRPIYTLVPDNTIMNRVVGRGSSTQIHAVGANDGLRALTTYTAHLDGPTGKIIATIVSDADADLHSAIIIPDSAVPGGHTIDITGDNQEGETVNITQPFYIPVSNVDSDGDGNDDITDSCPGAINSRQDGDQDGIDDACDNLIGPPPPTPNSGRTTIMGPVSSTPQVLGAVSIPPNKLNTRVSGLRLIALSKVTQAASAKRHWFLWLVLIFIPGLVLLAKYIFKRLNINYNRNT